VRRLLPQLKEGSCASATQDLLYAMVAKLAEKAPSEAATVVDELLDYPIAQGLRTRLNAALADIAPLAPGIKLSHTPVIQTHPHANRHARRPQNGQARAIARGYHLQRAVGALAA
jgi:hypothetical protein